MKNTLNPYELGTFEYQWWERGFRSKSGICRADESQLDAVAYWEEGYEARVEVTDSTTKPSYKLSSGKTNLKLELSNIDQRTLIKKGLTSFNE